MGQYDVRVWLQSMPSESKELLSSEPKIRYVSSHRDGQGNPVLRSWDLAGGEYLRLRYSDGMEFILDRKGTRIWAAWPNTLAMEDASVYLLGPVLGFVLRLRGITCLHASAVCVEDKAIALVGPAGAGKSTTAAYLSGMGYPVLSDDVVALSDQGGSFIVQPAYPCLRLWPSSVNILYGAPDRLPRLVPKDPTWDKRFLKLAEDGQEFQIKPLPLAAIYLLAERSDGLSAPFVECIVTSEGLIGLIANTYANYLLDASMRAQEFETLSRIAQTVPFRRITPHTSPALLSKLGGVIVDDFKRLAESRYTLTAS